MRRRSGMSLVEVLIVIAVIGMLIPVAGRLFADGWRLTSRSLRRTEQRETAAILIKLWDRWVAPTAPDEWRVRPKGFAAGSRWVRRDAECLVFCNGKSLQYVHVPASIVCTFSTERPDGMAPCAVLTLHLPAIAGDRVKSIPVRLVACGGKP